MGAQQCSGPGGLALLNKVVVVGEDTFVKCGVLPLLSAHLFPQSGGKPGVTQVPQTKYEIHYLMQLFLNILFEVKH